MRKLATAGNNLVHAFVSAFLATTPPNSFSPSPPSLRFTTFQQFNILYKDFMRICGVVKFLVSLASFFEPLPYSALL
jgi:hypothetical protein